jgi:uncharacterized protein with HEPN domain
MQSSKADKQRLLHIRDAINEIESYVAGLPASAFFDTSIIKSACVFQLEVIGEAANHLSTELKNENAEIEWHQIVGVRNIIAHVYWGIDYTQVWDIIKNELPVLRKKIDELLHELN